jgi:hypothetical protein
VDSQIAFIFVLMLESLQKTQHHFVHRTNAFVILIVISVFYADCDHVGFGDAVPDWFGEVLAQSLDGILILAIGVDDMLRMAEFIHVSCPRLLGFVSNERIDFFLEHVEEVDATLEDEALSQLNI